MRSVCLVNPTKIVKRPVSELAKHLQEKGHDVCVLTPSQKGYDKKEHHLRHLEGVRVVEFRTFSPIPVEFEWPVPSLGFIRTLRRLSSEYDTFQVWTHFYVHVLIAVHYLKAKGKRVIMTMDTLPGDSFQLGGILQHLFRIYNRTLGRWVLGKADVLTVYGESLRTLIKQRIRPKTDVVTIPTGIEVNDIRKQKRGKIRKELGLEDTKIITFIGLVGKRKGIDIVMDVAKEMSDENVVFLVVGDSPKRRYWQKRSPSNMLYLGRREDIFSILRDSEAFFLPSRGEGLPGVVMEAMVAGVPVVASRIPCIDDLVQDGVTGYLNEVSDIKGFCVSLRSAIHAQKMGREGQKAIRKFDWNKIIEQYEAVY